MIRVFSHRCGGKYRLYVTGHADYAPGNDIVCAGVSALIGALVQYAKTSPACRHLRCRMEAGEAFLSCRGGLGAGFDMIVGGLAAIAASYPEHVTVQSSVTG